jgi:hypothetical protein
VPAPLRSWQSVANRKVIEGPANESLPGLSLSLCANRAKSRISPRKTPNPTGARDHEAKKKAPEGAFEMNYVFTTY